jgi:hypothetical protein
MRTPTRRHEARREVSHLPVGRHGVFLGEYNLACDSIGTAGRQDSSNARLRALGNGGKYDQQPTAIVVLEPRNTSIPEAAT